MPLTPLHLAAGIPARKHISMKACRPLSEMSLTAVIRRMNGEENLVWVDANGDNVTVHGFLLA